MDQQEYVSTGIKGLDKAIDSLRPGDTVTWQMENVGDYMYVATQFVVDEALTGRPMVYLRFGDHEELIPTEVLQARGANIRKIQRMHLVARFDLLCGIKIREAYLRDHFPDPACHVGSDEHPDKRRLHLYPSGESRG